MGLKRLKRYDGLRDYLRMKNSDVYEGKFPRIPRPRQICQGCGHVKGTHVYSANARPEIKESSLRHIARQAVFSKGGAAGCNLGLCSCDEFVPGFEELVASARKRKVD